MKILAIDTSGTQAGVAVTEKNRVVLSKVVTAQEAGGWKHSQKLLPTIAGLLEEAGLTLADIGKIAYTCGPGSFTGLRIGAAVALGLARGAGLPVVQVPTLDAMAYAGIGTDAVQIVPMLDARRGEVYSAVYEKVYYPFNTLFPKRVTDYFALPKDEMLGMAGKNAVFITEAVDPAAVGFCAFHLPEATTTEMLYVRPPQAVREAMAREAGA